MTEQDDLTRALAGVPCIRTELAVAYRCFGDKIKHPECIAAFLTDPSNAPLLLGIPVVKALVESCRALQPDPGHCTCAMCDALAPFTKTGEDQ